VQKSHYLSSKINSLEGFRIKFDRPFFKEFVVETKFPVDKVISRLCDRKIMAGVPLKSFYSELENCFLVAVTEKRTRKELDYFVSTLRELF
jgi:glycine dehydrogenase subunit 1